MCTLNLPESISKAHTFLYSDDMAIVTQGSDPLEIAETLSSELKSADDWSRDDKLSLNTGKTKVM